MAYVYRHIRLDKNVPFYIGIGSDSDGKYERAFKKTRGNNRHWTNITNKIPYEVEIVLDDLTWEKACSKEIEFISLYGRFDLGKGTLVNLTHGGEGVLGLKMSEERRKSHAIKAGKPVAQYNLDGEFLKRFDSCMDASRALGVTDTSICNCANFKNGVYTAHGHVWRWHYGGSESIFFDKENYLINQKRPYVKVNSFDKKGSYIKSFNSISEAAIAYGIHVKNISNAIRKGQTVTANKIIFKYYDGDTTNIDASPYFKSRFGENAPGYGRKGFLSGRYGIKGKDHPTSIPVLQVDKKTNNIIDSFENIRRASEATGADGSAISKCLKGKLASTGGFKWRCNK